ncbi:MAG: ABC transporter ATP-binding protein [Dehalococcoidia bacterium]|nr:ABC transporter ATP-binding protein [Dehalococcoidia bacterium]
MSPVLTISEVTRSFPSRRSGLRELLRRAPMDQHVLRGVHMQVQDGEWYCVIGQNGTGKTTLLRIVAGLTRPSSGAVQIDGVDVRRTAAREQVGYALADERSFHWRISAFHNLVFFARLEGLRPDAARRRVDTLLERFDLVSARERPFGELSTGMRQRLAIARGLIVVPRVLLMDEPTRSLDPGHATDAMHVVRDEMRQSGGCVLMVTHQLDQALAEGDRIGVLHGGVIADELTPESLARTAQGAEGVTVSVRGMQPATVTTLRTVRGVRDIHVSSSAAGEQQLEIWTQPGELALDQLMAALTDGGALITGFQRGTPMRALLERLASLREAVPA